MRQHVTVPGQWGKDLQGLCHLDVLDVSASSAQRSPGRMDPTHTRHPIRTPPGPNQNYVDTRNMFSASLMEAAL